MTEMKTRIADHHEHHFPCDCGDWHYLDVSVDDVDETWRFLSVADTYWPHRYRDRIKAAFTLLRGKSHCHNGVLLDLANATDVKAVIDAVVNPVKPQNDPSDQDI